jgi:hypothetical protein
MKCGTTSLHYYLDLHPQIHMSKRKEPDFFIAEKNWHKGVKWYELHFSNNTSINGESSTSYTKYPRVGGVPQRMYSVVPQAKLIYVVRDPIDRIISHYIHECAQGREVRTIGEALQTLEDNLYIDTSSYYLQLRQFLEFYALDRILVISAEDLRDHRLVTLRRIFGFLKVDDQFESQGFSTMLHQSFEKRKKNRFGRLLSKISVHSYKFHTPSLATSRNIFRVLSGTQIPPPIMDASLRYDLIESLKGDVRSLRSITGMSFERWCL